MVLYKTLIIRLIDTGILDYVRHHQGNTFVR